MQPAVQPAARQKTHNSDGCCHVVSKCNFRNCWWEDWKGSLLMCHRTNIEAIECYLTLGIKNTAVNVLNSCWNLHLLIRTYEASVLLFVDTWRYQCWRLHTDVPTAVSVMTYRTTQGALKCGELHCIVVWRKDRTIVEITSDRVPKERTVNGTGNHNTAIMCQLLSVRQFWECLLQSVSVQNVYWFSESRKSTDVCQTKPRWPVLSVRVQNV